MQNVKEKIIKVIMDYYKKNNIAPTSKLLIEEYNIKKSDIIKYFGSFEKALIDLGLKTDVSKYTEYNSKEFNNLYSDYISGMTYKELSNKYKISKYKLIDIINKSGKPLKNNRWTSEKIKLLQEIYPYEEWDIILFKLKPFNKTDIVSKASKLRITRDCFGYNKEQEKFLIDNYEKYPIKQLSKIMGKTESSIASKASKLGLVRVEKWSNEEIDILTEKYPTHNYKELEKLLPKRHKNTIVEKANMLGLKKDKNYNYYANAETKKKELIIELNSFAKELGRTPTSKEINNNKNMSGILTYHRYFGSYSNACIEAGLEVNSNLFGKSFHLTSENGDVCLSKKEKEITDLLIYNNIEYEKEVPYRDIIEDQSIRNIRCDWLIGDVVIEYFGMPEKEYYKNRMIEKIDLAKKHNLKFIDLYEKDVDKNFKGLIEKFKVFDIQINI